MSILKVPPSYIHKRSVGIIAGTLWLCAFLAAMFVLWLLTDSALLGRMRLLARGLPPPQFVAHFGEAAMNAPRGLAVDGKRVLVADNGHGCVRVFSREGTLLHSFGEAELEAPYDVVAYNGFMYVSDHTAGRVQRFTPEGVFAGTLLAGGDELGLFLPTALTVDREQGHFYITDIAGHRVVICDEQGTIVAAFGTPGAGPGSLSYPGGIAVDEERQIYVADSNNGRVQVFAPQGKGIAFTVAGGDDQQFVLPGNLSVDSYGHAWIVDTLSHKIYVFVKDRLLFSFGELGSEEGQLYFPAAIAFDDDGDYIFVTERALNRVSVFRYPELLATYSGR